MDFFENQERARKRTSLLVFYFLAAVIMIVVVLNIVAAAGLAQQRGYTPGDTYKPPAELFIWDPEVIWWVSALTLLVIGAGTFFRWLSLRSGGRAVAEMAGGRPLDPGSANPAARRLLNIVEEMSIASGVPMPAVYVLEDEPGINAFAAGYSPNDAVVAVTRGCMERLNRDELQGVIAHEFSHILNGDMRLNIRLVSVLFGILMIAMLGRGLLRGMFYARPRGGGKGKGGGVIVIFAVGLSILIIGYIGFFFGRLIQAAVSRQREFLADAAAVQFTRNPAGIGGALKKIGAHATRGRIMNESATQFSHFFFSQAFGRASLAGLFATHPPLVDRIRAIDPSFDGKFPAAVPEVSRPAPAPRPSAPPPVLPSAGAITAAVLLGSIGAPTTGHVNRARQLIASLPPTLARAAREPAVAPAAVFALLISSEEAVRSRQFERVSASHAGPVYQAMTELAPVAATLTAELRLPLLSIALPALRALPPADSEVFLQTVRSLIKEDDEVTLFEFAVLKALGRHMAGAHASGPQITSFNSVAPEFSLILSTLSRVGADTPEEAVAAFRVASARVPMLQGSISLFDAENCTLEAVGKALDRLANGSPAIRKVLLAAACEAAASDGTIELAEAELLRAIADSLDCPVPPILPGSDES